MKLHDWHRTTHKDAQKASSPGVVCKEFLSVCTFEASVGRRACDSGQFYYVWLSDLLKGKGPLWDISSPLNLCGGRCASQQNFPQSRACLIVQGMVLQGYCSSAIEEISPGSDLLLSAWTCEVLKSVLRNRPADPKFRRKQFCLVLHKCPALCS